MRRALLELVGGMGLRLLPWLFVLGLILPSPFASALDTNDHGPGAFGELVLAAQETPPVPKAPVLDATDKALVTLATQAQAIAQRACEATPELKHYNDLRKQVDTALRARYRGWRLDWEQGVLVEAK